jgi:hypothetical protein
MIRILAGALLIGGLIGCQSVASPGPVDQIVVRGGTSFGECIGYCVTELRADAYEARLTRSGWASSVPIQTVALAMNREEWSAIVSSIDLIAFASLREIHGCPDCADGGAEWVELTTAGFSKRVTFEYGTELPEIARLLENIRKLRLQLSAEQP